ncbi:N-acetylmuramoyl-L-alanine amidase [Bifidobacterium sp. SO1]|uniref:peptidoglycan recognition protein family protein n=1 Tax=Bifidobacterium sp. SO1 TaxID=2809029 RepID=UPI001BDC06D0|nr:N-acetylmuramoyl-L-alanine amidase [Bifidobacterium sp. SO1]MBT1161194.1 N-acetylmuramoyl-L-alanine amidase [Bifidobacterium sp. SO1]
MVTVTWRGSPNHYDGRNGYTVDHITLHIMVGTLAGTDTCFRRADFRAASHYGVGSDGTIYQWVSEANGSWADANMASDCSGVTIEHAGGLRGIAVTEAEIEASAQLCADIARRYGWKKLWHDGLNGNIYLHREIPGTDHAGCPDRAVDNPLPVQRILDRANQLLGAATTNTTTNTNTITEGDDAMQAIIQPNDESRLVWFDGTRLHNLTHPDQVTAIKQVAKQCGITIPVFKLGSKKAPWFTRFQQAVNN